MTETTEEAPAPPPAKPPATGGRGLVIAGAICLVLAFVIPLITAVAALVIGIVLLVRRRTAAGVTIAVLSIVCAIVGLGFIASVFVKVYRVPSVSMKPTLDVGQRILVNRLSSSVSIGDIVVFHPPSGASDNRCGAPPARGQMCPVPTPKASDQFFVKRVVAGPGDTVALVNGAVIRNGRPEHGYRVAPCGAADECNFPRPIKVPAGDYLMIGDNRGSSVDSRFWGPVPKGWIVGPKVGPTL